MKKNTSYCRYKRLLPPKCQIRNIKLTSTPLNKLMLVTPINSHVKINAEDHLKLKKALF